MSGGRRTRFDAFAAGLADGETDRATGLTEPREDLGEGWPWYRAAYASGYFRTFPREGGPEPPLPEAPLALSVAGAVAEAVIGAWAARDAPLRSWRIWVAGAVVAFGGQRVEQAARRRRARRSPAAEPAPPLLIAPGLIARNQGFVLGWWLMRRRGDLGNGWATRLGRNLCALAAMRAQRRANLRAWNEKRPREAAVSKTV